MNNMYRQVAVPATLMGELQVACAATSMLTLVVVCSTLQWNG